MGWNNRYGSGKGADTITSGLEGAWTDTPVQWSHTYFNNLFGYEWELTKSPAGAHQWKPVNDGGAGTVPDAHDPDKKHAPFMLTTDLSLKMDPEYEKISRHFHKNPQEFADAYSRAWFKLTHRDMGPKERYLGPEVPQEELIWQDPIPAVDYELVNDDDIAGLKSSILTSGHNLSEFISTAWASASTFRGSDKRGGANGARVRLAPQNNWEVNNPQQLKSVLETLERIQNDFNNSQGGNKKVSLADLIVLAGSAAVEKAASDAGYSISVPFRAGRADASAEQTDVEAFEALEPIADGFRNYLKEGVKVTAEELLVDKANLLTLTAPEMTVLVAGMRVLNTNFDGSNKGVFTDKPGTLSNDFLVSITDLGITWKATSDSDSIFVGSDRRTGEVKYTGTRADLIFGSNSELRALAEAYAADDAREKFVKDFVKAWDKVMNLDRY